MNHFIDSMNWSNRFFCCRPAISGNSFFLPCNSEHCNRVQCRLLLYGCYFPNTLRDSVSPVWRIFSGITLKSKNCGVPLEKGRRIYLISFQRESTQDATALEWVAPKDYLRLHYHSLLCKLGLHSCQSWVFHLVKIL